VVNRKGGSGKSTLAAHLAAWCAHQGHAVMLGDIDRQQSTRSWLRRRNAALPAIAPWNVDQNILRVPHGITHVVLDTPGGLHGLDLARMVMFTDIILMPVCGSAFDRESAADCYAELQALPRVANGRCRVACIGMRLDPRSRAALQQLRSWAAGLGLPVLGTLRETPTYVQCLERGMTLFDLPPQRVATDLAQWEPILAWLRPQLAPGAVHADPAAAGALSSTSSRPPLSNHPAPQPRTRLSPHPVSPVARKPAPTASPLPDRPRAAPLAVSPTQAPMARPAATPVAARLLASRPLPAVGHIGGSAPVPERNALTPQPATEAPPIPSFLKLMKC
jgi:chromosome partitioning protein